MSTVRRQCEFTGHVQGVGFRYTAQHLAMQYAVCGFVRNTPQGTVELVVEGEDREVDQLIDSIKSRMEGFIRQAHVNSAPPTGEFSSFGIRH